MPGAEAASAPIPQKLERHYGWLNPQFGQHWRRPPYFCDVGAPVANLGRGSPTGVACYRHAQFPEQPELFARLRKPDHQLGQFALAGVLVLFAACITGDPD